MPGTDGPCSVESSRLADGIVLTLRGELDLTCASEVEHELLRAQQSHNLVVLDLRELSFMDSTGLGLIVRAQQRSRESGGRLVVTQGRPRVQRLFELTGLIDYLEVISEPSILLTHKSSRKRPRWRGR